MIHTDLHFAIGQELKRMRKAAGMNQTELAPMLGVDQSALSRVENGKQALTAVQWVQFCRAAKISDSLTTRVSMVLRGVRA